MKDLTPRNVVVLQMLVDGNTVKEIALALGIRPRTVKHSHIRAAREKLNATSREQLIARAVAGGYVRVEMDVEIGGDPCQQPCE